MTIECIALRLIAGFKQLEMLINSVLLKQTIHKFLPMPSGNLPLSVPLKRR